MSSRKPPEVAEGSLAKVIGETVALHLGQLLAPLQPACIVCVAAAKAADREYEIACANASAAAEPEPGMPDVAIRQSLTVGLRGPVCWECFSLSHDTAAGAVVHIDGE